MGRPPSVLQLASSACLASAGGTRTASPSSHPTSSERIETACARDGLTLVDTIPELDVSGGAPLSKRQGLRHAIELVEDGQADVLVVAYFDRLVRSLAVQAEVFDRVERAGGGILAVDVGEVRADTASRWLSSTMLGMVAEYHRRVTAERTADAKLRAVERGVPPFPNIPPYLPQRADGTLEPIPKRAKVVAEAVRIRADGATIREIRDYLRKHGIKMSYPGVQALLSNRMLLGELHFGKRRQPQVAQADHRQGDVPAGAAAERSARRRAKSERLLARLEVLRCGTCGARMVVGTSNNSSYHLYRCPPVGDCKRRVTISAELAESVVVDPVAPCSDTVRRVSLRSLAS
jgi:DNA invertase Pin-like site-specific DNA recombinase